MSAPPRLTEFAYAEKLPYWTITDGLYVMHDGTLALGYRIKGAAVQAKDDGDINLIAQHLREFLNALPIGFQVQLLRHCMPVPEALFDDYLATLKSTDPILRAQRASDVPHLRAKGLRTYETFLFISKPKALGDLGDVNKTLLAKLFDTVARKKDPLTITREAHRTAAEDLERNAASLSRYFASAGIATTRLTENELAQVAFTFLNPSRRPEDAPVLTDEPVPRQLPEEQRKLFKALSLREQLVQTSLSWNVDTLYLEDPIRPYRVMGLKAMPPSTEAAFIRKANRIPFEHWLSVAISVPDSEKKYEDVQKRRNRALAASVGYAKDIRATEQAAELEAVMTATVSRDQRFFNLSCYLLFGADDLSHLDVRTHQAVDVFRGFKTPITTVQMGQLQAYLGMLPGNSHRVPHRRTVLTDNAADFLPVFDYWQGDRKPMFLSSTRNGEPFFLDLTAPERINWNINVFGGSGGGKTFLVLKQLTSAIRGQDSPLIVIDVGGKELGSYYRLCQMLGGDFISLDEDGSCPINPFFSPSDLHTNGEGVPTAGPSDEKVNFLVSIAALAVRDPGTPALGRVGIRILRDAILTTYERVARVEASCPPLLSDLAESLDKYVGDVADAALSQTYAKTLRAFLSGPAGKLLNHQSRVNIRSPFVVFDMKGLEKLGDVGDIMLLVVGGYVWNMIAKPRKELAWVIYDETWKLMKNEAAQGLLEELYRTARKLKTGVITITQRLADFLDSPASQAVLSNTTVTFLMRHESQDHDRVATTLELTPREAELFSGLEVQKGYFSEFFVKMPSGSAVGRYSPAPYDYWVNTTDGKDRDLEAEVLAAHRGDRPAALSHLVENYPNGAAAGAKKATRAA